MELTTDLLLRAYSVGLFPMAASRHGSKLHWLDPERRGIMPLDRFHLPKRLARTVLSDRFEVDVDRDFAATIAGCATPMEGRDDTWINPRIEHLFTELHHLGHAHSVECRLDGALVGLDHFGAQAFQRHHVCIHLPLALGHGFDQADALVAHQRDVANAALNAALEFGRVVHAE